MGALHFRMHEMKIANNVKQADALNTLLLIGIIFKINVAGTVPKVCMQFQTPLPPLAATFHFVATLNFVYGPLGTFSHNTAQYVICLRMHETFLLKCMKA